MPNFTQMGKLHNISLFILCLCFACSVPTNPKEKGCLSTAFWQDFDAIAPHFHEFLVHNNLADKGDHPTIGVRNFLMSLKKTKGLEFEQFELQPDFPTKLCVQFNSPSFYNEIFLTDTILLENGQQNVNVPRPNLQGNYFSCLVSERDSIPFPFNQLMELRLHATYYNTKYIVKHLIDFEPKMKMDDPMLIRFIIAEFFIDFVAEACGEERILSSIE